MNLGRGQVEEMEPGDIDTVGLNTALSEATCLGIDVNTVDARLRIRLEVLSLPEGGEPSADRRVDVVLTGVRRVAASLRFHWWTLTEPEETVLPLTLEGLDEAIKTFGGGCLHGWEFVDSPENSWKRWAELLSFDTTLSEEPARHTLEFSQQEGSNNRELDMRVWFSGLSIENSAGDPLATPGFIADGTRWWQAHRNSDPRTAHVWHVNPPL